MNALKEDLLDSLDPAEFRYFKNKIFELAGISLSDAKIDLVRTRLRSRLQANRLSSYYEYKQLLETLSANDPEWESFINILTTNKTDWFREPEHFEYLKSVFIPQWLKLGKKHLKVWCAASSTGEEPYTLALVLSEALKTTNITFEIIASDIDTTVLQTAKNGVYHVDRLYQIPSSYQQNLVLGTGDISSWFKLKKEIKNCVQFRQLNLVSKEYGFQHKFDIVFCRNVLIYFDQRTISEVVTKIHHHCEHDSVLIIGHSESLQNTNSPWNYKKPSIYTKGKKF